MLALDLRHAPLILAVEHDHDQATWLASAVRRRAKAELVVVRDVEAAIAAIDARVPDVVLVPALLSPRDEGALLEAVRTNPAAAHVQMLTIPVLVPPSDAPMPSGGLLARFRRQKTSEVPAGAQVSSFAEQIAASLKRALESRSAAAAPSTADESGASEPTAHEGPAETGQTVVASSFSRTDSFELPNEPIAGDAMMALDAAAAGAGWPEVVEAALTPPGPPPVRRAAMPVRRVAKRRTVRAPWDDLDPFECGFTTLLARLQEVTKRERCQGPAEAGRHDSRGA